MVLSMSRPLALAGMFFMVPFTCAAAPQGDFTCSPKHYVEWEVEFGNCMCSLKENISHRVIKMTGTSEFKQCDKECATQFSKFDCI